MKKFILMIGILAASMSFGATNPSLKNDIEEQSVSQPISEIEPDDVNQNLVVVSFYIKDLHLHIIDIEVSQNQLVQLIVRELSARFIKKKYSDTNVNSFKFIIR